MKEIVTAVVGGLAFGCFLGAIVIGSVPRSMLIVYWGLVTVYWCVNLYSQTK